MQIIIKLYLEHFTGVFVGSHILNINRRLFQVTKIYGTPCFRAARGKKNKTITVNIIAQLTPYGEFQFSRLLNWNVMAKQIQSILA